MKLVSVIVPAFNEVARISGTIDELLAYFDRRGLACEIIVAADGTDGTREAASAHAEQRSEVRVIGSPERRGKGRAIREAVTRATGDIIGFTDADNKTPITEFDKIEEALTGGCDIAVGSRGFATSRIERAQPLYRRIGGRTFGLVMHAIVGLRDITDTQCGFKFFRASVARDLFARQRIDGYMFDVEILYIAQQRCYTVAQVPVVWRDDADSRLELVSGTLRNARDLLSIRRRHHAVPRVVQPAEVDVP